MAQQSIPMPDGVHLSATLYLPGDAQPAEKFPALLEYLPIAKTTPLPPATIPSTPGSPPADT
jgi:predicted acyl esterase